jgi:hypothetical protein
MFWRSVAFGIKASLVAAALLLTVSPVLAGDRVHSPPQPAVRSQLAPPPVVRVAPAAVSISVALTPAPQPAPEPVYVAIRGPDGTTRRFPVEGGRAAIRAPSVVVLGPGASVTISLRVTR